MESQIARGLALALILGLGAGMAVAQNSTSSVPLGDLARKLKAQRAKSGEKSKVFTNDDLSKPPKTPAHPAASPAEPAPTEAKSEAEPAKETSGKEAENQSAKAAPAETAEEAHGEKYYRERMKKLQDRLDIDQRELSVLQQKLGQNQVMFYPDPSKGLLQRSGPTAMSDVNSLQDQITKKKAEVAADQEAIDNLREQLRREGGDAGWLR
jgi:hypothetical protein